MYFSHLHTVADIKTAYRELAMQHHPDRGGHTATMQAINAEYHEALQRCDGQTETGSDDREHTYHYHEDAEQAIIDKIADLIAANVPAAADVYLIGTWVWIVGDTKPIKETLKELKCRWHAKRKCWYWHPHTYRHRYSKHADLGDLAYKYGARKVASAAADEERLAA